MLILISAVLLLAAALTLLILRILRPEFRFTWLTAIAITFLAWITVLLWQPLLPLSITFPTWESPTLLVGAPAFSADGYSWPYAIALVTLALATLLTSSAREGFPDSLSWAVSLTICGLGLLAVTAENPLTLILIWGALDLAELLAVLRSVQGRELSERAVVAFSIRATGIVLVLLASVISSAAGGKMDFLSTPPQAGLLLLAAAGLRLGVIPLNLPYGTVSTLSRGVGTTLRLVSAAASMILLTRIPTASLSSPVSPILLVLAAIAALYGGWMWLRAPDELNGLTFWVIALASLAVACALRGDPAGAAGWGVALLLSGGALLLTSVQQTWLNRSLLIGAWALSALPFSLTASAWQFNSGGWDFLLPAFLAAQACVLAGFIRHALRPSTRESLSAQPVWVRSVYPAGIGLLLLIQLLLGFGGWQGALSFGLLPAGIAVAVLTAGLLWAAPRFRIFNPVRAHWLQPTTPSRIDRLYQNLWTIYRWFGRVTQTLSDVFEGEGGFMWTLLFLIFFVLLIAQRKP